MLTLSSISSSWMLLASEPFCIFKALVNTYVDRSGTIYTLAPCLVRSASISDASLNRTEYRGLATGPNVSKIYSVNDISFRHDSNESINELIVIPLPKFPCLQKRTNSHCPILARPQILVLERQRYSLQRHIQYRSRRF